MPLFENDADTGAFTGGAFNCQPAINFSKKILYQH